MTKTVYVSLPASLLASVEGATPAKTAMSSNGTLYDAWVHDSGQLQLCKPRLDAIIQAQPPQEKQP